MPCAPGRARSRYVWLLLKQPAPLASKTLPAKGKNGLAKSQPYWDIARFTQSNALQLVAYNFAHVTGYGTPASKRIKGRRRRVRGM